MTTAKYPPGPWTHEGQGDITGIENDPANGCVGKVDVCSVYLRTVPGRHEANARLIAAAPELLEALQRMLPELRGLAFFSDTASEMLRSAEAAIAKATGETP